MSLLKARPEPLFCPGLSFPICNLKALKPEVVRDVSGDGVVARVLPSSALAPRCRGEACGLGWHSCLGVRPRNWFLPLKRRLQGVQAVPGCLEGPTVAEQRRHSRALGHEAGHLWWAELWTSVHLKHREHFWPLMHTWPTLTSF